MSARDAVLAKIAGALGRSGVDGSVSLDSQPPEVSARLQGAHRHTLPHVDDDLVATLISTMESVLMSVVRLQSIDDCVSAVDWYLESEGIDVSAAGAVTVAPALGSIAWPGHYAKGPATGVEKVSITPCIAAVAETGSIVTVSGEQTPATLNFLPETHIIVVRESQLVRHVDDVFPLLRSLDLLPRAVNFVTGPSRTADIEQTLEIGAHGPRRMHVLLLPD
ncbi:MAG: lactate utilization protein C [Granulosicoccus sp.]